MKGFTIGLALPSWKLLIKLAVLLNKLGLGLGFFLNQYKYFSEIF